MTNVSEQQFESEIADWLVTERGYQLQKNDLSQGSQPDFDPTLGLDTAELFTFIGATQIDYWNELVRRYAADQSTVQVKFANRLAAELDHGIEIRLAYFEPAHRLSDRLVAWYNANRLTVTHQLRFQAGSGKTVDLALLVNGIVVATAELKNPLTGQGVEQAARNQDVVFKFLDDKSLAAEVVKIYSTLAQAKAKVAHQAHCPIGELLHRGEDAHLEFKSTLRTDTSSGAVNKNLETAPVKSVAAFANSLDGGTLLIGVADDGSVHGMTGDYTSLHKDGKDEADLFQLHLQQALINAIGEAATCGLTIQRHTVEGNDLNRVHVPPSPFPVDAKVTLVHKTGRHQKRCSSTSGSATARGRSPTRTTGTSTCSSAGARRRQPRRNDRPQGRQPDLLRHSRSSVSLRCSRSRMISSALAASSAVSNGPSSSLALLFPQRST